MFTSAGGRASILGSGGKMRADSWDHRTSNAVLFELHCSHREAGGYMRKQSIEEKAVLRKIESGRRLSSDDKIIQARMRSIQRKHLEGQTTGIPANAQTQILPNAFALTEAVRALAASMYDGVTPPNF